MIEIRTRKALDRIVVADGLSRSTLHPMAGPATRCPIDVASRKMVASVKTGLGAHGVTHSTDSGLAFVTNIYDGTFSVIDLAKFCVVSNLKVGKGSNGVTYFE